jgi:hypothetical protein
VKKHAINAAKYPAGRGWYPWQRGEGMQAQEASLASSEASSYGFFGELARMGAINKEGTTIVDP